jgi:hypothetical protein
MNIFFEVTVKYSKMGENGQEKRVTETYLIDAVNFSEAETRIYLELEKMVSGEFKVMKIQRTNLSEIIPSDMGDRWYRVKVTFITFDESSGKEKRVSQMVLAYAETPKLANDLVIEAMKGMMADFEITAISESNIIDIFPYEQAAVS